ncbi:ABC transporter permease [Tropicimonas sediminicola]|uniref:Iron(III) transport system permease protein n=1 Tax=Tropicimonas sediminicola TaxID=1031541 RepID=A0A239L9J3_9RHOB|nr:iron ABC transporter permease [Tropicimonas sediminicola]SNT27286.1 iron(III) transport system permease protein [Tropicimonas sediminicola]
MRLTKYLRSGEGMTLAAVTFLALALFVFPLGLLARVGLTGEEGLSLAPLGEALASRSVLRALGHSLVTATLSACLSLVAGTAIALVMGLTDIRWKGAFTFLLLIPMMIPPHVTAIAWIQAMGPSSPILRSLGMAPELGSTHPLYSPGGMIFLLGVQHTPLVFLVVLAALRTLPREMSDAARIAGARPVRLLLRILLPLLAPILIAAWALAFVSALGNFGIQALLGIPARYITLPVLIWQRLASFGPSVLTDVAVIAALLALVAVLVILAQMALLVRSRATLIGPPQPPLHLALGAARPWAEGALAGLVAATLVLPMTALVATALVRTYGLPLNAETITLDNFIEILFRQSVTARAFLNSTLTAAAAAGIIAIGCVFLARFMCSRRRPVRRTAVSLATLAEMTYAIPGLVISIAFILAFIKPLPVLGVSLYNTLGIIFLAYLCAFFSIALKPVSAAYVQLDPALDEAARIAGGRYMFRMRRIFLPLIAPAAASGAILVFLTAYNEVTVSALLWSTGNETIGTTIYNYEDGGYTTLAAAMSSVTVLATILLMVLLDQLGRRAPPGVVPWRI